MCVATYAKYSLEGLNEQLVINEYSQVSLQLQSLTQWLTCTMSCFSTQGSYLTHLKLFSDHPGSDSRKSNSFCKIPLSCSTASKESSQHNKPALALTHRAQPLCLEQAVTGKTHFQFEVAILSLARS